MEEYIKLFENHTQYEAYKNSVNYVTPNVSYCEEQDEVHYNPYIDPFNGYEYVDLGLPSGTLWATMNVGATSVTDYGDYYMYGMGSKTYDSNDTPYAGTEDPLSSDRDTASVVWGGGWHTPTEPQVQELIDNTTYQWAQNYQGSGINGGLFTAQNGKSVFFPFCGEARNQQSVGTYGCYWTSSPFFDADGFLFTLEDGQQWGINWAVNTTTLRRSNGYSIRPVWNSAPAPSGDR